MTRTEFVISELEKKNATDKQVALKASEKYRALNPCKTGDVKLIRKRAIAKGIKESSIPELLFKNDRLVSKKTGRPIVSKTTALKPQEPTSNTRATHSLKKEESGYAVPVAEMPTRGLNGVYHPSNENGCGHSQSRIGHTALRTDVGVVQISICMQCGEYTARKRN